MKKTGTRLFLLTLVASLGLGLLAQAQEPSWVIDSSGKRWLGSSVKANSNGEIKLTSSKGEKSFVVGTYSRVYTPKPADLSRAEAMVYNGQYDGAIPLLEAVEKANRYLNWDYAAGLLLVKSYLAKDMQEPAMEVVNRLQAVDTKKENPYLAGAEIEIMIAQGNADAAGRRIDSYLQNGPRRVAAMAQLRRGDLSMDKDLYDTAILDYLRTTVFFKDVDADILAEAYYKTGVALKKKKDATRAQNMFQTVVKNYPNSYWASQAKSN